MSLPREPRIPLAGADTAGPAAGRPIEDEPAVTSAGGAVDDEGFGDLDLPAESDDVATEDATAPAPEESDVDVDDQPGGSRRSRRSRRASARRPDPRSSVDCSSARRCPSWTSCTARRCG